MNACGQTDSSHNSLRTVESQLVKEQNLINPEGKTIAARFNTPITFNRIESDLSSFEFYLQNLPLKNHGTLVHHYDGTTKENYNVYEAVVDLEIGKRDLHQCADAIMRLRAEFLWNQKRYDEIHFNFTNGFRVDYSEWMKGRRVVIKGNKTYWNNRYSPSNSYQDFWKYLELIFSYAGTLSLSKELKPVSLTELKIGDVFIKGGSPGHAVIVVDVAVNAEGEKLFLLAQSYMPAQDLQILKNPNNSASPWYSVRECENWLETPEWGFKSSSLTRF